MALGEFTGGCVHYWPDDNKTMSEKHLRDSVEPEVLDTKMNTVMLDGCRAHEVAPFKGRRYSLVFFTSGSWEKGDDETMAEKGLSSFTLPTRERLEALTMHVPPARGYSEVGKMDPPHMAQWPRWEGTGCPADFVLNEQGAAHQGVMRRWLNGGEVERPHGRDDEEIAAGGQEPVFGPEGYRLKEWERYDVCPKKFVTVKKGGPNWMDVVRRDVFDAATNQLIASDEVTDENRDTRGRWQTRLPNPRPDVTRTVLFYRDRLPDTKGGRSGTAEGRTSGLPEGCEYNRHGELCKRDVRGFLYPLDENGERRHCKDVRRPPRSRSLHLVWFEAGRQREDG